MVTCLFMQHVCEREREAETEGERERMPVGRFFI